LIKLRHLTVNDTTRSWRCGNVPVWIRSVRRGVTAVRLLRISWRVAGRAGAGRHGRLLACVVITDDTRKGWINRLAVDPGYRRQGLAARLMLEAEQALREKGIHVFAALIEHENTASLSLFQREGTRRTTSCT